MDVQDVVDKVRESLTAQHVFGEPIERDGTLVIPVAKIRGGAGGGGGTREEGAGSGSGFGVNAAPAGAFTVSQGKVTWRPALDVNRIILGGQIVMAIALLTLGRALRLRRR